MYLFIVLFFILYIILRETFNRKQNVSNIYKSKFNIGTYLGDKWLGIFTYNDGVIPLTIFILILNTSLTLISLL